MRRISVIGIGAGDPDYLTIQATKAMNRVDVFFFLNKGSDKEDLMGLRREICKRHIDHDRYRIVEATDPDRDLTGPKYNQAVSAWHDKRVELYQHLVGTELSDGETGAFLVWGDPSLYDGTLRILEALRARTSLQFELDVVPGISAIHALTARHKIPLNQTGGSVQVTTGRRLAQGWPAGASDVVVMLDTDCAFLKFADEHTTIYWAAYLGTDDEILISGMVAECGKQIEEVRSAARERKSWMFDTYLLRREA